MASSPVLPPRSIHLNPTRTRINNQPPRRTITAPILHQLSRLLRPLKVKPCSWVLSCDNQIFPMQPRIHSTPSNSSLLNSKLPTWARQCILEDLLVAPVSMALITIILTTNPITRCSCQHPLVVQWWEEDPCSTQEPFHRVCELVECTCNHHRPRHHLQWRLVVNKC